MGRPVQGRHRAVAARSGAVFLPVVAVLVAAGTAFAYWSTQGSGTAQGMTAGTAQAVTLTPGTPTAQLYPGGQANVALTVSNPNGFTVHFSSLSLDTGQGTGGFAVDPAHTGCVLSVLTFTTQTNGGAGWTAPAKVNAVNGTLPITLTNALAMGSAAASACQGATFTVYLVAA